MKSILFALSFAFAVQASAAETYCREVKGGGLGQPPQTVREHCVTLGDQGTLVDNGSTFFGNPPEVLPYQISGNAVLVKRNAGWEKAYEFVNGTLQNGAGAILYKK